MVLRRNRIFADHHHTSYWSTMAVSAAHLMTITCYCLSTLFTLDARLIPSLTTVHHQNKSTAVSANLVAADESTSNGQAATVCVHYCNKKT